MTLRKIEPPLEERIALWKSLIQAALDSHQEGSGSTLGEINLQGVTREDWALMEVADQALVALIAEYEKLQCSHERTLRMYGKCSDRSSTRWPGGEETDGYVPRIRGLGGGDDIAFTVCVDCGKIQGLATPDEIQKALDQELADREDW